MARQLGGEQVRAQRVTPFLFEEDRELPVEPGLLGKREKPIRAHDLRRAAIVVEREPLHDERAGERVDLGADRMLRDSFHEIITPMPFRIVPVQE